MIRGFVFIITLLTHGASFNHSNPTILLLHNCVQKVYYRDFYLHTQVPCIKKL